ncbi:transposase [Streptomyces celluloflavus]|uniref:Transposase n=1 Tax=Streptomyces celluloflavus TaxID=58344 RepID=A0ABW7RI76_9ACTN
MEDVGQRRPDQTDGGRAEILLQPLLRTWRFEHRDRALDFGRPAEHDLRDIMDAVLYVDRTGVQWRYLPHDFPHWNTVYGYMEITARKPGTRGFTPIPKRWAVERTYGRLMLHRRPARDYEALPTRSECRAVDDPLLGMAAPVLGGQP